MAVTLLTYGQQLQEVQNAITAVTTSQRYSINGREVHRADLEWLHKRELHLSDQLTKFGDITAGSQVTRGTMRVSFGDNI